MIPHAPIYGMNRKRMRKVKHMSCGQKRNAMYDLLRALAKLAIIKRDTILDANLTRWDEWIFKGRVEGIDAAYKDIIDFHGKAFEEHDKAYHEDSCGVKL